MINYKFVQLNQQKLPKIEVDKRNEIVSFGSDNDFPKFLLDLSIQSSLHTSILDKKIKLGVGDGFIYNSKKDLKTEKFINNPNPFETLNDILFKCYTDLEIFGGFALQVLWARDKKNIAEIYHCPFQNLRSGKVNKLNFVENYYYYNDWTKYTRIADTEKFKTFNEIEKIGTQILYAKKYTPTNLYYPLPSYIGGLNDINTLHEISIFHNACITNNFQPGIMIVFRGPRPTEEEQDAIVKALEKKYKGAKNAGTPSIFFLDTEQQEPKIIQTQINDLDKQYSTLTEAIKESVVMSHSIPRILASLEKPGSLGGSKEYIDAQSLFMNDYIIKQQSFILRHFNKIMKVNGLKELTILNSNPSIMLYDISLMKEVLTRNEIRNLYGYEPLNEDNKNEEGETIINDEKNNINENE